MFYGVNKNKKIKSCNKHKENPNDDLLFFTKDENEEDNAKSIEDKEPEIESKNKLEFKKDTQPQFSISYDDYNYEDDACAENFLLKKRKMPIQNYDLKLEKVKDIKSEEINVIVDLDEEINVENYEENNEINIVIEEEEFDTISKEESNKKIIELKKLREEKRKIEHKEETYDQDYIEITNLKAKELLKDVYSSLLDAKDVEQSDEEILQWEVDKLKNGIGGIKFNINNMKKKESNTLNINNLFMKYKTPMFNSLDSIISNLDELNSNNKSHYESKQKQLVNYMQEIEESKHQRLLTIQKIDDYIGHYILLKKIYAKIVKDYKKYKEIDIEDINEKFVDEYFYFSDN